jgi:hypothetical protein
MILDRSKKYLIVSSAWYDISGEFACLTSRHGNVVVEGYSNSPNQRWTVTPSGQIQSASSEATYLAYDPDRYVKLHTLTSRPERGWIIQDVGDYNGHVRLMPIGFEDVCIRSSYGSHFVEAENCGHDVASATWYLLDSDAFRISMDDQ